MHLFLDVFDIVQALLLSGKTRLTEKKINYVRVSMVRTSTWVHRGLASAGLYHFLPNTKMFKICMCFYELQYFITTHNPPPPHKIINFTQFCREQIIIKQLHYLYPPFSILHIMGSAIQKQWWLILNLYFDPPLLDPLVQQQEVEFTQHRFRKQRAIFWKC